MDDVDYQLGAEPDQSMNCGPSNKLSVRQELRAIQGGCSAAQISFWLRDDGRLIEASGAGLSLFGASSVDALDQMPSFDAFRSEILNDAQSSPAQETGESVHALGTPLDPQASSWRWSPRAGWARPLLMITLKPTSLNPEMDDPDADHHSLAALLQTVADWTWRVDNAGCFTALSAESLRYTGALPRKWLGRPLSALCLTPSGSNATQALNKILRERQPFRQVEISIRSVEGKISYHRLSGSPLFNTKTGQFGGYCGVGTEITESKRIETALNSTQADLQRTLGELEEKNERLNRMLKAMQDALTSKDRFLATMSHELRTPLNAIIGFSEIMVGELFNPLGDDRYREYVADIHQSASHLHSMITDILEYSKIQAGQGELDRESVALAPEVTLVRRMLAAEISTKGQRFTVEIDADLPPLFAERRGLRQVLINLLNNAIKYTPNGGTVWLRARSLAKIGDMSRDDFCGSNPRLAVVMEIGDNGIGMDPNDINRLAEPFERGAATYSRRQDGSGLGIPLAKSIVEMHAGKFAIDSAPGQGTTIHMTLPAASDSPHPSV